MRKPLAVLSAGTLAGLMALGTANALVADTPITVTPVAETAATSDQSVYEVGDAGTVTIANNGASLSVVSVNQTSGWVIEIETASGREVEVDFRLGTRRIQFSAELEDGQIRVKAVESSTATTSTTSTSTTNPSTSTSTTTSTTVGVSGGAVSAGSTRYDAGVAGSVDIVRNGGVLEITSVNPASGWTFEVEVRTGREVELDFRRGNERVQFNAELEDGAIRVRVRNRSNGGDGSPSSSPSDNSSDDNSSDDDSVSDDDNSDDDHSEDDSSNDSSSDNSSDD